MDTLAKRFAFARQRAELKQSEVAEMTGLSKAAISNIERGISLHSPNMTKIGAAVGASPEWLMTGKGEAFVQVSNQPSFSQETQGDRIKARRIEMGMRQEDLAHAAGTTKGTISQLESGLQTGSRKLPNIARILNVSPIWLETGHTYLSRPAQPPVESTLELKMSIQLCSRSFDHASKIVADILPEAKNVDKSIYLKAVHLHRKLMRLMDELESHDPSNRQ